MSITFKTLFMDKIIVEEPPKNISYLTNRMVNLGIKEDHPYLYDDLREKIDESRTINEVRADLARVLDKYEDFKNEKEMGHNVILGAKEFMNITMMIGGAASTLSFGTSIMISGVAYGMDKGLDWCLDEYDEEARESSRAILTEYLRALKDDGVDLNELKVMKPEDAVRKAIAAKSDSVPTVDLDKVDEEGQLYLNHHLLEGFSYLKEMGDLNDYVDLQPQPKPEDIQKQAENVGNMGKTLVKYQEESNKRFDDLQTSVSNINKNLKDLSEQVGENAEGIAFMKEFMYGKMTPQEQLSALRSGKIQLKDQKAAIKAKEILVQRIELTKKVNTFLNGTQVLAGIASDLGILKPEMAAKVNQAVAVGSAVFNGAMSIMSGNYLGALQNLGSLIGAFKKKGPDVATKRHQQIMKRLAALQKGQQQIMKNQQKLFEGQQKIMELQVKTFNTIIKFAEEVDKKFRLVIIKLAEIHHDILVNRRLIVEIMNEDIDAGELFLLDRYHEEDFDPQSRMFVSYEAMQSFFESNVDNFQRGVKALEDVRTIRGKVDSRLLLETYKNKPQKNAEDGEVTSTNIGDFINKVYIPTFSLTQLAGDKSEILGKLLTPVREVEHVVSKMKFHMKEDHDERLLHFVATNLDKPLSTDAVLKIFEFLIESQVYMQLVDHMGSPDGLMSPEEAQTQRRMRTRGRSRLREAMHIVDLAIAQQSLLAGEPFYPVIAEKISEAAAVDDAKGHDLAYSLVSEALSRNGLLRRNFIMHFAHQATYVDQNDGSILYASALKYEETSDALQRYFGKDFDFEYSQKDQEKGLCPWSLVLPKYRNGKKTEKDGVIKLRLPTSDELMAGKMEYQNDMSELLGLRDRMVDAMLSYDMIEKSDERDKKMLLDLSLLKISN